MIENDTLKAFSFDILLPDELSAKFCIFTDLAELLGYEFNHEALAHLVELLRKHPNDPKRKLSYDYEADRVSLRASKAEVILLAARLINDHSIEKYRKNLTEEDYTNLHITLAGWKRRKPHPWQTGDYFHFRLSNGEFAFGQVLSDDFGATCALFALKSVSPLDVAEIKKNRVVSILHLVPDRLKRGAWKIIANDQPVANPDTSRTGQRFAIGTTTFGGRMMEELAEAYFCLAPWNVGYFGDDHYFDKLLLRGVKRPAKCIWLSGVERDKYRKQRGITAK